MLLPFLHLIMFNFPNIKSARQKGGVHFRLNRMSSSEIVKDMIIHVVIGKKNVELFLRIHISPGSFPSHGTFPTTINKPPTRKSINPNNIRVLPNELILTAYSLKLFPFLFYFFLLREETSAIILPVYTF